MLRLGDATGRNCQGLTRRELLQVGGCSVLGLSLAGTPDRGAWSAERGASGSWSGEREAGSVPSAQGRTPNADSCILFWLSGGPSQHETFDPKPEQPVEVRGPYAPVETNVSGIRISSLLPQLARQADKYTILRSLTHDNPNHAYTPMLNGGAEAQTAYGAVVTRFCEGAAAMPPYVHLGNPIELGAGVLGAAYNPVTIPDPTQGKVTLPDFSPPERVDTARFDRRRRLVDEFDSLRVQLEGSDALRAADATYRRAITMLSTPAVREAFELSREPRKLRERYGASVFGQSCLLARRLVEAGTRFVQVQWSERGGAGWDTHGTVLSGIFEMEQYLCPRFDQGMSALLWDLDQRGLLRSTLVLAIAEFGRTPVINNRAGRDHWPYVFSALVAGGGVPGGTVVGSSDLQGAYPASRPVTPGDLATTIYRLLGLSPLTDDRLRPFARGEAVAELLG